MCLLSNFTIFYYSCSIFKTPFTQIEKSPVLRTGGNDNSKSRYENDPKIVMAFWIGSPSGSQMGLA